MLSRLLSRNEIKVPPMPAEEPAKSVPWNEILDLMIDQTWRVQKFVTRTPVEATDRWFRSRVTIELFRILGDARAQSEWTMNPFLAIHRLCEMMMLMPVEGKEYWQNIARGWIFNFTILELTPKPSSEEFRKIVIELGQITSLFRMASHLPSWHKMIAHLRDVISEIEFALEMAQTRDWYWMMSWEWIQILNAVIQASNRVRGWKIDPEMLVDLLLGNLRMLNEEKIEIARMKLQAFAGILDDYVTESA
jgi:hypothetical protein